MGDLDLGVPPERPITTPAPGQILFYPRDISETEILIPYGKVRFASVAGPLAGTHVLTVIEGDELLPQIRRVGGYFHEQLNALAAKHGIVKEVRGFGMMLGMELNSPGKQIVLDCMQAGLLINCTHDTVLRFLPPYIITELHVDEAMEILTRETGEGLWDPRIFTALKSVLAEGVV